MSLTILEQRSGRLPAELTSFIGRADELAEITRLFGRGRLVTLVGPGGVGKSRLAVRAAGRVLPGYEHGVCFVDLAPLREPSLLAPALAGALGLPDPNAGTVLDVLVEFLAERRTLLVLDTCEHLVDACALLAEVLLRNAPGLHILATSRQPLDIAGEHTLNVAPLPIPVGASPDPRRPCESVRMFAERAAAVVPEWRLTPENQDAVVLLCRRLDGIPLALELAAVQLRALSVEQIVDRLDRRVLHVRGRRTAMPRHRTLENAIDWSHDLCSPGERLLWTRLSVFAGDFDLESAEQVCADAELPAGDVFDLLAGLVDKSIVRQVTRDGEARYRMLDTIREYGAERLDRRGEAGGVRDRAFAWFAGRVERAHAELASSAQPRVLAWFRDEQDNVRALIDHGIGAAADGPLIRAGLGLGRILALQGLIGEARYWSARILACRDLGGDPAATELIALAGLLAVLQNDLAASADLLERAEARASGTGDDAGLAYVRQAQGMAALYDDRTDEAVRLLTEATVLHRAAGADDVLVPIADLFLSVACCLGGDTATALEHAERAVAVTEGSGDLWCRSYGLLARGTARLLAGAADEALADVRAGLAVKRDLGDRLGVSLALDVAGGCLVSLAQPMQAARLFGCADRLRRYTGSTMFGPQHALLRGFFEQQAGEALGADAYRTAYETGESLETDIAVAEALAERPAPDAPGARPDRPALTPREREIAGLVAAGLTNREIADRLVIAKRTADSHVEHILAKLGFSSRAEIVAWVAAER
ncbi:putative HTH-type transcriptional regulator [Actinomadura rubteroloni]|uniref:Putative HTH-type transcriptional regulator n=1 Tax=Actinomadura rubteroloni TaxID=1926885 RepID=A0A2P4UFH0_9ACTN|nr:LuxR C-terminal-related transcriptional regulator [Actinomadura rubteroloni]POM23786.1 putative HTH-type transcriptional regulator [Actinomadura rubteroloni]